MSLDYPKKFTATAWKALEKEHKLPKSTVTKDITALEKAVDSFNAAIPTKDDLGGKANAIVRLGEAAADAVDRLGRGVGFDDPRFDMLRNYQRALSNYLREVGALQVDDHRGLSFSLDRVNSRVTDHGPMKTARTVAPTSRIEEEESEDEKRAKPVPLVYPKPYTDPEWKKLEKVLKLSNTGVGKLLRDLEAAVDKVNVELVGAADGDKLDLLRKAAVTAASKARDKVKALATKKIGGTKSDPLFKLSSNLGDFHDLLKGWKLDDHRGLDWTTKVFNSRVQPRHQ